MARARRFRGDSGMSLAELLVSMFIISMVSAITMTAVVNVFGSLGKTDNDTQGLTDVRVVQERMSRDLRDARGISAGATASQLQIWIDGNSDYVKTNDEVWTWQVVNAAGSTTHKEVQRVNTGTGAVQVVGHTLVSSALFTYNNATVTLADVVTVDIQYDAIVGKAHKTKHVDFSIKLRNYG